MGAERGGWQEKGEVRDLVSPRTPPSPLTHPFLSSSTHNTHACLPCAQIKEACCALGEALVVKEPYYIQPMASGQPTEASGTYN